MGFADDLFSTPPLMARARLIRIGFFENEELAQLPDKARLLYAGLWLLADRAGRLEDRPLRIRGQIFPYEIVDVDALLDALVARGFIVRYVVGDVKVISIPKFLAHQAPHHREPDSKLPANTESPGKAPARPRPSPGKAAASPSDPVPDPVPDPVHRSAPSAPKARAPRSQRAQPPDPRFEVFWQRWPRKVDKVDALKAWAKLNPSDELVAEIYRALDWQVRQPGWQKERGRFIPHAATWLNGRRWEDEPFEPQQNQQYDDGWFEECKRQHDGQCGGRLQHDVQKDIDTERARAALRTTA
jgi:hypothetical protein